MNLVGHVRELSVGERVTVVVSIVLKLIFISVLETWQLISLTADDMFFYFIIARNLATGEGATIASGLPTNGFHPLYATLLVPVFKFVYPFGIDLPMYFVLVTFVFLNAVTAILLYSTVGELTDGTSLQKFALLIWLFSPFFTRIYFTGMEPAIQAFFICATIYYYISIRPGPFTVHQSVGLGILLGLTFLSRMDAGFLAFGLGIVLFADRTQRSHSVTVFRQYIDVVLVTVTTFLISLPWLAYGYLELGRVLPVSGPGSQIQRLIRNPEFSRNSPLLDLIIEGGRRFGMGIVRSIVGIQISSIEALIALVFLTMTVILVTFATRVDPLDALKRGDFLLLTAVLYVSYYVFISHFSRTYYHLFTGILVICLGTIWIDKVMTERPDIQFGIRFILAGIVIINVIGLGLFITQPPTEGTYEGTNEHFRKHVAREIQSDLPKDALIGLIEGGIIQYYDTKHDIVIVHPKVNPSLLTYVKNRDFEGYIEAEGFDYLIVNRVQLNRHVRPRLPNYKLHIANSWTSASGDTEILLIRLEPSTRSDTPADGDEPSVKTS